MDVYIYLYSIEIQYKECDFSPCSYRLSFVIKVCVCDKTLPWYRLSHLLEQKQQQQSRRDCDSWRKCNIDHQLICFEDPNVGFDLQVVDIKQKTYSVITVVTGSDLRLLNTKRNLLWNLCIYIYILKAIFGSDAVL